MRKPSGKILAVLLLCLICSFDALDKRCPAMSRRSLSYIDAHKDEAIALLETTFNIASPTEMLPGKKGGRRIHKELVAGLTAKWIDMPPEMERAGIFWPRPWPQRQTCVAAWSHRHCIARRKV